MMIVAFYKTNGWFVWNITKKGKKITKQDIESLLFEYQSNDAFYDEIGWKMFLINKGYKVDESVIEYGMFF